MSIFDWVIFIVGVVIALIIFIICMKETCPYCLTSSYNFDDQVWNRPCKHCGRGMVKINKEINQNGDDKINIDWMFRRH